MMGVLSSTLSTSISLLLSL
uniref:Uncharacterized protein n=1 Tax=Anguilla anguilla TaxID=7936 RepID=A0A0E9RYI3_ANGAN